MVAHPRPGVSPSPSIEVYRLQAVRHQRKVFDGVEEWCERMRSWIMSFQDMSREVAEGRIAELRHDADAYRRAQPARRRRRSRARHRWSLHRRAVALRLSVVARTANELLGAIISPPWPTSDQPRHYAPHGR
jgi:hypothetical protein